MRTFEMVRNKDESGVSGTGKILEGVVFSDGATITRWIAEESPGKSTSIWDSFGSFISVHVLPHPANKTEIRFNDGEVYKHTTKSHEAPVLKAKRKRKGKSVDMVSQEGAVQVPVRDVLPAVTLVSPIKEEEVK